MRFLKPLDDKLLHNIFKKYQNIICVEDGTIKGGFGSAIVNFAKENNYNNYIKKLGVPDNFVEHGSKTKLVEICGFDANGIAKNCIFARSLNNKNI